MDEERRSSRRDLFRLFGRTLADAATRKAPLLPGTEGGPGGAGPGAPGPGEGPFAEPSPPPGSSAPADEIPAERGSLVADLAVHPIVPGSGRRFRGEGAVEAILLARVTAEHLAAVGGDCPLCGSPLLFD